MRIVGSVALALVVALATGSAGAAARQGPGQVAEGARKIGQGVVRTSGQ
jgi:hypothetical protein